MDNVSFGKNARKMGWPEIRWDRGKVTVDKKQTLKYKILYDDVIAPTRAHEGDLGYDLYASHGVTVLPHGKMKVGTGVAFQFPAGWGGFIKDRSSMATKTTLETIGGVIDNGYIGELFIVVMNYGDGVQKIEKGQKIAQMVMIPVANYELEEVDELQPTDERGDKGFGSTGR